ncbi:hypothetical protein TKK_0012818 [Trichogramma kaykai]
MHSCVDERQGGYQSTIKNYRDYEGYPTYMSARPSNFEPSAPDYISPYSKSDHDVYQSESSPENLYYNDGVVSDTLSSSSSNEARTAYYKTKYASESAANALRASPSPSTVINEIGGGGGQNQPEYSPLQSAEYSTSASYSVGGYGERQQQQHQHQQPGGSQPVNHHRPGEEAAGLASEYVKPSGNGGGAVYGTYSSNSQGVLEYPQRPSPFAHNSPSQSEYSSPSHLPSTHTYTDYLPHHAAAYKAYSAPKYQSLLGALKSLFGGGDSPTVSATGHYPIYYSPQSPASGLPPSAAASLHHPGPHGSPSVPVPAAAPPSYYYSGAGPPSSLGSNSPYSKSYMSMPTMRFVHGPSPSSPSISSGPYGGGPSGVGSRIVLVRDSSGAHTSAYPSHLNPGGVMAPSAAYPPTRSRYYFSPASGGPPSTGPSLFYTSAAAAQNAALVCS